MALNAWDMVIKVKYGDTLKRFGAYVHGQSMDYNMTTLRAKIIDLFKFSPDVYLILNYIDEDGDVVALNDDDELRDAAISQHLNPLRITVQMKANPSGKPDSKPLTASSAPTRWQPGTPPAAHLSTSIDEALKSEQIHNAIPKINHDSVLKPAAHVPSFSNLGSSVSQPSHCPRVDSSGSSGDVSINTADINDAISYIIETEDSNGPAPISLLSPSVNSINPVSEHIQKQHENGSMPQFVKDAFVKSLTSRRTAKKNAELVKGPGDAHCGGNSVAATAFHQSMPPAETVEHSPWHENCSMPQFLKDAYKDTFIKSLTSRRTTKETAEHVKGGGDAHCGGIFFAATAFNQSMPPAKTVEHSPWPKLVVPPTNMNGDGTRQKNISSAPCTSEARFNSLGGVSTNRQMDAPPRHVPNPIKTSHSGVQCVRCGMCPITGPRFKSNMKEDYDLCKFCYVEFGRAVDFTRTDLSPFYVPWTSMEFDNPRSRNQLPSRHAFRDYGAIPQLNSFFVRHVTISDGSRIAPSKRFTKIWRMRNCGTTAWPFGTQLVWGFGIQLEDRGSVQLEIPVSGCPVGDDVDIAVDFTAPAKPGTYSSYWQMISPSGHMFGQVVWVSIQVISTPPNPVARHLPHEFFGRGGSSKSLTNKVPSKCGLLGSSDGVVQPVPALFGSAYSPISESPAASSKASQVAVVPPTGEATDDSLLEEGLLEELDAMERCSGYLGSFH